jgi:Ca2+-binding RTX toxin-like protein
MARIVSRVRFDLRDVDLNTALRTGSGAGFLDNTNYNHLGKVFQDVAWYEYAGGGAGPLRLLLGGSALAMGATVPTAGSATGLMQQSPTTTAWTTRWSIDGFSFPAGTLGAAMATTGTEDDQQALRTILGSSDTMNLSESRDWVRGFGGNDFIRGNGGDDHLAGDGGHDTIEGGAGNDEVLGGAGSDRLFGGGGADTIVGGAGHDIMQGGAGADIFDFNAFNESVPFNIDPDMIQDFTHGVDRIDLRTLDANALAGGDQAFTGFIGSSATFTAPGQMRFASGVLSLNTDTDAQAELVVHVLPVLGPLSLSDLLL